MRKYRLTLCYYSIQCYHTHFDYFDKHCSAAMDTLTTFDCSDTDWTNSPNSNLNYKGHTVIATKQTKKKKQQNENIVSTLWFSVVETKCFFFFEISRICFSITKCPVSDYVHKLFTTVKGIICTAQRTVTCA